MTVKRSHPLNTVLFTAGLLLAYGCSSTRLTTVWQNEEFQGHSYRNILVIGVGNEEHDRRVFEQRFADELEATGIKAEPSYRILNPDTAITRENIATAIKGRGVDAVLVTHLVGVDKETIYHQPVDYVSTQGYYNGLYSYYPTVHNYVSSPGYYTTHDIVKLETNIYDVRSEKLIWSARSETFAPESAETVIDDVIRLIIKDLKAKQIIE